MAIAQLVLSYLQVFVWPFVALFALFKYRKFIETVIERVIESLASQSEVTISFAAASLKIPLKTLVRSLEDNLGVRELSAKQLEWLKKLRDEGRIAYDHKLHYEILRPLRNAGLITQYPGDFLAEANEVEITTLGKLLFEALERNQKSH